MEKREELKQVYDIFTAAWRIYKTYYPPNDLRDDDYWSKLADVLKRHKQNITVRFAGIYSVMLQLIWNEKQKHVISKKLRRQAERWVRTYEKVKWVLLLFLTGPVQP